MFLRGCVYDISVDEVNSVLRKEVTEREGKRKKKKERKKCQRAPLFPKNKDNYKEKRRQTDKQMYIRKERQAERK